MEANSKEWHRKLDRLATSLLKQTTSQSAFATFEKQAPELFQQIQLAGEANSLLKLWGQSRNVDDNTGTLIVESKVLQVLSQIIGVSLESPIVHAGIEHTYGYLLSLIETPYGKKRERWVSSYLEQALGLSRPTFTPVVAQGTLLSNLTYFLGRIHFRGRRSELGRLRRSQEFVDQELIQLNYRQFRPKRIFEETRRGNKRIRLITDLLSLPEVMGMKELHGLLIYGVENISTNRMQLITTFPVTELTFKELLMQPTGRNVSIQLKYNCYVEGDTRKLLQGTRTFQ